VIENPEDYQLASAPVGAGEPYATPPPVDPVDAAIVSELRRMYPSLRQWSGEQLLEEAGFHGRLMAAMRLQLRISFALHPVLEHALQRPDL
jgi:hypothetical protein